MVECEEYPKESYNGNPRRATSTSSSSTTSVHVTALDGLVNVKSLFTIAMFVGLSLTTAGQHSLENRAPCDAGIEVTKKLLLFEVVSFSFFLFSSLVAQGLKLAINLLNNKDVDEAFRAHINLKVLRFGMMASAVGSIMGCLFFMLSMVNVIQIRLEMCLVAVNPPFIPSRLCLFWFLLLSWFTFPLLFMLSCIKFLRKY